MTDTHRSPEAREAGRSPSTPRLVVFGASYAKAWRLADPHLIFVNKGANGQQSWELLARFERDVLAEGPRAVLIWGFINDIFRTPPSGVVAAKALIRTSMTQMIDLARQAGIEPVLGTEVPIRGRAGFKEWLASAIGALLGKQSYQARVNAHVREVNEWMRTTARERNLLLLDLYGAVADARGQRRAGLAAADGSHLNAAAYEALTAAALPELRRRFAVGRA